MSLSRKVCGRSAAAAPRKMPMRRGQQKGCRGQAESGGQTVQHQAQGRCLLPEGVSEIQENRARRESGILHRDRIVQAQLVAHLLDAFFRGFDAHHDTNGVTYHTARDEDECENSECDANRVDGASEKIGKNWTGLYCGGARSVEKRERELFSPRSSPRRNRNHLISECCVSRIT